MTLRPLDFLGALALLVVAALFAAAGRWLEALIVVLVSAFGVLLRADITERGIAGGHAAARAHVLAAQAAALFLSYALVAGLLAVAAVRGWTSDTRGAVATYSLVALTVFLTGRWICGCGPRWTTSSEEQPRCASALSWTSWNEGWWVAHDVPRDRGGNVDHLAWCDRAAYAVETKSGRFHPRQLGRIKAIAAWAKQKYGQRWVQPVICVCSDPPPAPQYEHGVWILAPDQLVDWLRSGDGARPVHSSRARS